jgi:carbon monoxide dehydrogenase subunit G
MKIERSIEIAASPEKVWSMMFDKLENSLQWHPNVTKIESIGEQQSGVGTMMYIEEKLKGRLGLIKMVIEVTEVEENRKQAVHQVLGSAMKNLDVTYTLEPTAIGCRLTASVNMVFMCWIIDIILWLVAGKNISRKHWETVLANVKRLAEA